MCGEDESWQNIYRSQHVYAWELQQHNSLRLSLEMELNLANDDGMRRRTTLYNSNQVELRVGQSILPLLAEGANATGGYYVNENYVTIISDRSAALLRRDAGVRVEQREQWEKSLQHEVLH